MTSGLPTIDYFLSAEDLEPPDAVEHYSESLIRLPHLGCCYQRFAMPEAGQGMPPLAGLRTNVPLLVSPGVPYKYAPQHDHVFVDIAKRLRSCQIVFFTNRLGHLSDLLKRRLEEAFAAEGLNFADTCLFVPWLDRAGFHRLLRQASVCLDTIGFSGFNTAMEAIECGLPTVTTAGRFLRGRFAAGILRRMGLADLVAETNDAYVELVVRLAGDASYLRDVRHAIEERRHCLFGDLEPVRGMEQVLSGLARA
jgi:predicted O-linked N-acetylglucosamine transferase (SPINDLY family)